MLKRLGLVLVVGLGVVGCSSDEPDRSSAPACVDIWVKGAVFPEDYEGCLVGSSLEEPDVVRDCTDPGGGITYRHTAANGFLLGDAGYEVAFYPTSEGAEDPDSLYGYYFGCEQP